VDDYGHHPTEIRATLAAAREGWDRRIVAVFQPHRYSRVRALVEEFARSFYQAEVVIVAPIYAAGEEPIPGVTGELLYEAIRSHGHRDVRKAADLANAEAMVREILQPGDIVITLGAGDVNKVCERLLAGSAKGRRAGEALSSEKEGGTTRSRRPRRDQE
jgi:UDP-N-acetylmuramate--alanine ligase